MSSARKSDIIDIACEIRRRTERAIAVADGTMEPTENGGKREKWFWLPLSLVEVNEDGTVSVPEWKAQEVGLI